MRMMQVIWIQGYHSHTFACSRTHDIRVCVCVCVCVCCNTLLEERLHVRARGLRHARWSRPVDTCDAWDALAHKRVSLDNERSTWNTNTICIDRESPSPNRVVSDQSRASQVPTIGVPRPVCVCVCVCVCENIMITMLFVVVTYQLITIGHAHTCPTPSVKCKMTSYRTQLFRTNARVSCSHLFVPPCSRHEQCSHLGPSCMQ